MRVSVIAAAMAGSAAAAGHAAVLVDTGLTPRVALYSAFDEFFTCDQDDNCKQDYEQLTRQASLFHIAATGVGTSVTLAVDPDNLNQQSYAIYRDDSGQLIADAAHLLWQSARTPTPIDSTPLPAEYEFQYRPGILATYALPNIAFAPGNYWIDLIATGPTIGREPALFAGTRSGLDAEQKFFDNEDGPYPFVNFDGLQASIRIDGTVEPGSATPEPASWALMTVGFGLTGAAVRRRSAALA